MRSPAPLRTELSGPCKHSVLKQPFKGTAVRPGSWALDIGPLALNDDEEEDNDDVDPKAPCTFIVYI